jgi:predicted phage baseplate assembly protein
VGQSDGSPGQRFGLKFYPLLDRRPGETLLVQADQAPASQWQEVPDFSGSDEDDNHYSLDSLTGELRFGPAIRQADGKVRRYGAIPPKNASLIFTGYRYGGGVAGNVQAGALNTLKTAIPFIGRVSNREAATGGLDAEGVEAAMLRLPAMLRARERAVTEADFEYFALQALPGRIGRVKCLQPPPVDGGRPTPGLVFLLVVPRLPAPTGRLSLEQLSFSPEEIKILTQALDERRLLTTRLDVRAPAYQWVSVKAFLRLKPGADQKQARAGALERLYRFLNPLTGGREGTGWPFGKNLYLAELYAYLQDLPNVQNIDHLEMYSAQTLGQAKGDPEDAIDVVAYGVVASGEHQVEFV